MVQCLSWPCGSSAISSTLFQGCWCILYISANLCLEMVSIISYTLRNKNIYAKVPDILKITLLVSIKAWLTSGPSLIILISSSAIWSKSLSAYTSWLVYWKVSLCSIHHSGLAYKDSERNRYDPNLTYNTFLQSMLQLNSNFP